MNFQLHSLKDNLVELKPFLSKHFDALYLAASDKAIWEQHPDKNRQKKL
jgi:hypothetical protein